MTHSEAWELKGRIEEMRELSGMTIRLQLIEDKATAKVVEARVIMQLSDCRSGNVTVRQIAGRVPLTGEIVALAEKMREELALLAGEQRRTAARIKADAQ